mmetsp:Transcript_3143/g.7424  ORF Transcript_3143/g.7424 Transcript_3143/m.7424 type:complete len:362 (-) Transcript_3143:353-1438(-)
MSELLSVLEAHVVLLTLSLPFSLLLLHLHLDDALELVALELGLLPEAALLLRLLLQPRLLEVRVHAILLLLLRLLLLPGAALGGLHGTLGPQRVHLRGLVLGLLLHGAEPGRLPLLVRRQAGLLGLLLPLPRLLGLLVLDDLLLFQLLREHAFLFDLHGRGVGLVHLLHKPLRCQLLLLLLLDLLRLQRLDLLQHEGPLLVAVLLLLHALSLAVLDLLNDDLGPSPLALQTLLLTHLVHLQSLEPLDLHHGIQVPLLFLSLTLHHALLLDLGVADGHDLGVEHHLIHVFHIIHVFIQHLLGPLEDAALRSTRILGILVLDGVPFALLLHLPDLLLAGDGLRLALRQGLLLALLLLDLLLLG